MQFHLLKSGEALPPPPAGSNCTMAGRDRLVVLRKWPEGDTYLDIDPLPDYDVYIWRDGQDWGPVVGSTRKPVVAWAFLRPAEVMAELRGGETPPPMPEGWRLPTPQEMADFKLTPEMVEHGIRLDERRKAEQEIVAYLYEASKQEVPGYWILEHVKQGGYRDAPQSNATPSSSHDLSEARGEVGGGGDRPAEQPVAQESEDLRPCPFCGGPAEPRFRMVRCTRCRDYALGPTGSTVEEARLLWNKRPIEDRLRIAHAEALSLVLAHEGRIEHLEESVAEWKSAAKEATGLARELKQQLAEEKQYSDLLERRLREEEGKFCSAAGANGMHREGGRQEAEEQVAAYLRKKADMFEQNNNDKRAATLLRVHAWFISRGFHRDCDGSAEPYPDAVFDRAQLRAEVEHETAGRIADWLGDFTPSSLSDEIRQGRWREAGPDHEDGELPSWAKADEEEIFFEEVGRVATESDPNDWKWARHQVCALVRWSLNLAHEGCAISIRSDLMGLLASIDHWTADKEEGSE